MSESINQHLQDILHEQELAQDEELGDFSGCSGGDDEDNR